jgi:hypothetical protein
VNIILYLLIWIFSCCICIRVSFFCRSSSFTYDSKHNIHILYISTARLLRGLPYSTDLRQGSFVARLEFLQPIRHLTPLLPRFHFTKHNNPPSPSRHNRISQPNNRTESSNSTSIPTQQCTQSRERYHQTQQRLPRGID